MGGGGLEGVHDALEVIVRVGSGLGEPDDLLGEDALAVDDGGHLAVGAAGIEADAAAAQDVNTSGIQALGGSNLMRTTLWWDVEDPAGLGDNRRWETEVSN